MKLGLVLRCLCVASGIAVGTAAALARSRRRHIPAVPCRPARKPEATPSGPTRRDYFVITKTRGSASSKWVLQGFGRYECLLFFASWREAMDQACFRTENLADSYLIQLTTVH